MPDESAGDGRGGDAGRRYGEREFALILRRAMEMQQTVPRGDGERALSLADIQQIASEVGIDPRHVRAAAMEVAGGVVERRFHWFGGPSSMEMRETASREVAPERWEDLVRVMRSTFGDVGKTGQLGTSLEWSHHNGDVALELVSVTPRGGRTELAVSSHHAGMIGLIYLPGGLVSLFAALLAASVSVRFGVPVAGAAAIGGGVVLGVLTATRAFVGVFVRKRRERIRTLLDRLRELIEGG
jgi:hypothetical protein